MTEWGAGKRKGTKGGGRKGIDCRIIAWGEKEGEEERKRNDEL